MAQQHRPGPETRDTWRVLVVDDDEQIRNLLEFYLEEHEEGFVVETAENGRTALEMLREDAFQAEAVLMDLSMPGMDGFETLRRLDETYDHLVTIVLSGSDGEADQLQAFDLGALDFVQKPFSPEVLTARLRLNLEREAELRQSWPEPWEPPQGVSE